VIYGYRLWAVELHFGMTHAKQQFGSVLIPLVDPDDGDEAAKKSSDAKRSVDYMKAARADINANLHRREKFGATPGDHEGAAAPKTSSVRFTWADREGFALRTKFEHGVGHGDGTLVDDEDVDAPDVPLVGKTTLHPYRATLVSHPTHTRGLLAVESRGRTCPMPAVVRMLRRVSSDNLRLRAISNLADEAAMMNFIDSAAINEVLFERWTRDDDGAPDRREVQMGLHTVFEGEKIRSTVKRWAQSYFGFQKQHVVEKEVELANADDSSDETGDESESKLTAQERKAEAARAKAERKLAERDVNQSEAQDLADAVFTSLQETVSIEFTDVGVSMSNDSGAKTFKPLSDFGRFPYRIGETHPSDTLFYAVAEEKALSLLTVVQGLQLA
jgi:hypothetical protein